MRQTAERELVSVKKFAGQCGISIRQAYNYVEAEKIAVIRLPSRTPGGRGTIRIDQAEVDAFIKRHASTPA